MLELIHQPNHVVTTKQGNIQNPKARQQSRICWQSIEESLWINARLESSRDFHLKKWSSFCFYVFFVSYYFSKIDTTTISLYMLFIQTRNFPLFNFWLLFHVLLLFSHIAFYFWFLLTMYIVDILEKDVNRRIKSLTNYYSQVYIRSTSTISLYNSCWK